MAEMTENLVRLRLVPGVGNATLWRLLRRFGDSDHILGAGEDQLAATPGVGRDKAGAIAASVRIDPRPEMEKAARAGVDIIPYDDPAYPKALLHTFDPPAVLYVKGRLTDRDQIAVGMVGTRRASRYGREQAASLAASLARGGYSIVSGLARGIDTCAHQGALEAGGRTVGVLGCGFDHMYPEENRDLALEMTRNGAVVSEFTMAVAPSRETFPTRNRIIAGMGLGLVVIEAPLRSGSLITARLANEIGRPVFVLPGRLGEAAAEGSNKLLRDGATVVTSVDDIFTELNPALPPAEPPPRPARAAAGRTAKHAAAKGREEEGVLPFASSTPGSSVQPISKSLPPPEGGRGSGRAGEEEAVGHISPALSTLRGAKECVTPMPEIGPEERVILAALDADWRTIDDIIADTGLPSGRAAANLARLRLKRLAEQGPGQTYRRFRNGG